MSCDNDLFEKFAKSAEETDEDAVEDCELKAGEKVIRFEGGAWMVKQADGSYWAIVGNEDIVGTFVDCATFLFERTC